MKILKQVYLIQFQNYHSELEFQVKENEVLSIELREKITHLWTMLDISHEDQHAFLASVPMHTPSNIRKVIIMLCSIATMSIIKFIGI